MKKLSKYQEQPYPVEKTNIVFLNPHLKKKRVKFVGYSWNSQAIFLYSVFLEHYFGIFPSISLGIFFRIYWEHLKGMLHEYFTNIYFPGE